MKVNNVGLSLNHKTANPFRTSRNSTTNPFQNVSFEGNTLPFADVFEGFEPKKSNKLKMITSSVVGSMSKLRSGIPDSIVNFVKRVTGGISNSWEYAWNKDLFYIPGERTFKHIMGSDIVDLTRDLTNNLSNIGKGISSRMPDLHLSQIGNSISETLNTDIVDLGRPIYDKWNNLISGIRINNNSTKGKSPEELKAMWISINEASAKKEGKVAA